MEDEYKSLLHNHIWILTNLPLGRKASGVFSWKTNANGEIVKYKVQVVAKGFSQQRGIDFDERFSPIVKYDSIKIVLVIVIVEDLDLTQFDIKTVYLYANLKEEIYMCQPKGFISKGQEEKVCLLKKSLYGFKQASIEWNKKFND
jgi:hypothetical protein